MKTDTNKQPARPAYQRPRIATYTGEELQASLGPALANYGGLPSGWGG